MTFKNTSLTDIVEFTIRHNSAALASNIDTSALVRELLANMPPPTPMTRRERLQRRWQDFKDGLRVMRGESCYIEWWDE